MRRGVAPSHIPTAGTTFPLDTLLLTLRFFLFPRPTLLYGYIARQPAILLSWQSQLGTNRCVEMNNIGHASM